MDLRNNKVFWITGLSGAGKTTTAFFLKQELIKLGIVPIGLDGDYLREILGNRFGYTNEERLYLAQCYSRLCKVLSEQNHTVICSTISMFHSVRNWNRVYIKGYVEIYLKANSEFLKSRDPKGLYNEDSITKNSELVGFQKHFEQPKNPDLIFNVSENISVDAIVNEILEFCMEDLKNES